MVLGHTLCTVSSAAHRQSCSDWGELFCTELGQTEAAMADKQDCLYTSEIILNTQFVV